MTRWVPGKLSIEHAWLTMYVGTFFVLCLGFLACNGSTWQSSRQLHTLVEVVATLLACFVGTLALIRYYSQKSNMFLCIGAGFLGTSFLDGSHALVTSSFYEHLVPSELPALAPWSWLASRFFLSLCLYLSWLFWRREARYGDDARVNELVVYAGCGVLTVGSFLFFAFAPLPRAYYPELFLGRPEELIPAGFFTLAMFGYARKGAWKTHSFESWLVLSLLVSLIGQVAFMSRSMELFDAMFDAAHILKVTTYGLVLVGLLVSTYRSFQEVVATATISQTREARLQAILDTAFDAIITIDDQGIIQSVNPAAEKMFGYSVAEVMGSNIRMLMPCPYRDEHDMYLANYRMMGIRRVIGSIREVEGEKKDGTRFPITIKVSELIADGRRLFTGMISDISDRKQAEKERDSLHGRLIDLSRRAGMADVATGVLHNVGNVLNSINVSVHCMNDQLRSSKVAGLTRACRLMAEQQDLGRYLTCDEKGQRLPSYLHKVAAILATERETLQQELSELSENVEHVKEIVAMQQSLGKMSGIEQEFSPIEVVEDAIKINQAGLDHQGAELIREYAEDVPTISADKHKMVQVLVNLISNAKHAVSDADERRIVVRILSGHDHELQIQVRDTGCGVPAENRERIFNHGFTTKESGHGFGLHSSALHAKELGGSLTVSSGGVNQGATFALTLPIKPGRAAAAREQLVGS